MFWTYTAVLGLVKLVFVVRAPLRFLYWFGFACDVQALELLGDDLGGSLCLRLGLRGFRGRFTQCGRRSQSGVLSGR